MSSGSRLKAVFFPAAAVFAAAGLIWAVGGTACYVRGIFGVPCPGCGLTRAWLSFFHGDFFHALRWHPLFWSVPILAAAFIFRSKIGPKRAEAVFIVFLVLFAAVYAVRMIWLFPHISPMTLNHHAVLPRLISFME